MTDTFAALGARVRSLATTTGPCLVAVDGPSGAGKSVFAERLARALGGPPVIPMDDFASWDNLSGWWPRLEEQVLGPLLKGDGVTYQQRDWVQDPRAQLRVNGNPAVNVEGE